MALFSNKQTNVPRRRQSPGAPASSRATDDELDQRYTFRRNRTLTGSSSSVVSSTNESNADLKSPRVQAHELAQQRRHIGAILGGVIVCIAVLFALISQFTAGVTVRAASDSSLQLDATYEKLIQQYFAKQPTERLRFLTDAAHLTQFVQASAPEVTSVTIDGSAGFGKSSFVIGLRTPIAGWSTAQGQEYVDASGASFARNYFPSPSVQIVDKSGIQVQAGQAVASNRFLGFVGQVVGLAKDRGYTVTQVVIPEATTRQVELRLKRISYPIKLSVDRPAGEQVEDMARAMQWMSKRHVSPKYIDVRVSGRAFYR